MARDRPAAAVRVVGGVAAHLDPTNIPRADDRPRHFKPIYVSLDPKAIYCVLTWHHCRLLFVP